MHTTNHQERRSERTAVGGHTAQRQRPRKSPAGSPCRAAKATTTRSVGQRANDFSSWLGDLRIRDDNGAIEI